MRICALQLPTLPMSSARVDYYLRECEKSGVSVVVLGEYVLNNFFKELQSMPKSLVNEQSQHKVVMFKELALKYNMTIIAQVVLVESDGYKKVTARFSPKSTHYYPQHFLVHFKHWNEEQFFTPPSGEYELPTFTQDGFKCAIVNGFELYYDAVWAEVDRKKVDVVLMPSIGAFDSYSRWNEFIKMRALTHNVYILRVNRVGSYKQSGESWDFYGQSSLTSPHGEMEICLGDKEELMIGVVEKPILQEARKLWGWRNQINKKGLI